MFFFFKAEHYAGDGNDVTWNTDDEIDNFQLSPYSSPLHYMGISDETVAMFIEMGFSNQMISRAIEETGGEAIYSLLCSLRYAFYDVCQLKQCS